MGVPKTLVLSLSRWAGVNGSGSGTSGDSSRSRSSRSLASRSSNSCLARSSSSRCLRFLRTCGGGLPIYAGKKWDISQQQSQSEWVEWLAERRGRIKGGGYVEDDKEHVAAVDCPDFVREIPTGARDRVPAAIFRKLWIRNQVRVGMNLLDSRFTPAPAQNFDKPI